MLHTVHVLLVDDESSFRSLLGRLLTRAGFAVVEASSGEEAVKMVRSGVRCDATVIDYRMPGLNGGETLRQLRESGFCGTSLLVTAAIEIHEISEKHGFDGAVLKPCSAGDIQNALEVALRRRAGDRSQERGE